MQSPPRRPSCLSWPRTFVVYCCLKVEKRKCFIQFGDIFDGVLSVFFVIVPMAESQATDENEHLSISIPENSVQTEPVPDCVSPEVDDEWRKKDRHIFILSSAGKPVYSRHGCEDKLVTLFGVMQALVSFVQDSDDTIESIYFGQHVLVFSIRGPLLLVAVSSKNDNAQFLAKQLTCVYNQIVSVLTLNQVTTIFEKRRNYDLRRLLSGSERLIDQLLRSSETQLDIVLNGVTCLQLPSSQREEISNAIISTCSKIKNLVFAILVGDNRLISLVRMKKYTIQPSDLHLIFNMVASAESFKDAESWMPICLPNFNANGFLHAHVSYLSETCDACLLLLTVDHDIFFPLSEAKKKITQKLEKNGLLTKIKFALSRPIVTPSQLGINKMRHFVYKCKATNHIWSSPFSTPYHESTAASELLQSYRRLFSMLTGSAKLVYDQLKNETMLGYENDKFLLLATFDPLISCPLAWECIFSLLQWLQGKLDDLIITNLPNF